MMQNGQNNDIELPPQYFTNFNKENYEKVYFNHRNKCQLLRQ
jgi:hypothetical protein